MKTEKAFQQAFHSANVADECAAQIMAKAIRILSPLVIASAQTGDAGGMETRVLDGMARLRRLSVQAQSIIGMADDDPHTCELTQALSHLIADMKDESISGDDISAILESAAGLAESLPDFRDADDSLPMMIKSALFSPVVRLFHSLSSIGMHEHAVREEIRIITESAISLSVTLAFSWSKKSGMDDAREHLFVSVLPATLSLTEQAWFEVAEQQCGDRSWGPAASPRQNYPGLATAIAECDMGWLDAAGGLELLLERLVSRLDAAIFWRMNSHWPHSFRNRFAGALCAELESLAVKAWASASEQLTVDVGAMDEEAFEQFSQGEGAEPMRLERFDAALQLALTSGPLMERPSVDSHEVVRVARKKLAFLWGISDAACQTRMVSAL